MATRKSLLGGGDARAKRRKPANGKYLGTRTDSAQLDKAGEGLWIFIRLI